MRRGAALVLALAVAPACRERDVTSSSESQTGSASKLVVPGPGVAPQTQRILYPSTPGSFVDLVERAKHGVVAIRAASPVKSGPAAMFPGAPETTADVALGTGFLIVA